MQDLRLEIPGRHIVVGFFTPNYKTLAETFSRNLTEFQQPHHLYAVESVSKWHHATLMKPEIVLRAMSDYPDRTVILSDVDCTVHGCLADMASDDGDVSLHVRAWTQDRVYPYACASSRLVAFQPTLKARELAKRWCEINESTQSRNDESCLTMALWRTMGLTITTIPAVSGADERAFDRHPLVTHESAHTSVVGRHPRPLARGLKRWKRAAVKAITGMDYDQWKYRGTRPSN